VLNFSTNVERCQLDNESGGLMNCIPTAAGISDALGITLNSARTLAYITNGNGVEECQINVVDGTLNQCISTGSYPLYAYNHYAYSITISPDNSYAYIALDSGTTQCQINKIDGSLYNCTWFPAAVGLSGGIKASLNSNFLYVSGNIFSGGGIVNSTLGVIGINSTIGTIESSIQYYSLPGGLYLMAFNKTGTYLYVSNNNSITQCQINNTTGVPTNCDQTGTSFVTPDGIAFDESNDYAYVANSQSTTVTRCQVSSTDGSFSNCIQSPSLFNRPIDLAYY
jgi:DNA-binding beta-propeller fold protein YncE